MPFVFLLIGATIGLLLRFHFIDPQSWLIYPYWLHAHSHVMFLGWILDVLCLAFITSHVSVSRQGRYVVLLWVVQALVVGMLISFPLQGYGVISIGLSAIHTAAITLFSVWFFRDQKHGTFDPSSWFARLALIFFAIASLGPLTLGPLMANGYGYTQWYYLAVYFYLHFQYNGTFTFGVLSVLLFMAQQSGVHLDQKAIKRGGLVLFISVFPTYLLSALWAKPPLLLNFIGFLGVILQILATIQMVRGSWRASEPPLNSLSKPLRRLLMVSVLAFVMKSVLQLASSFPVVAELAAGRRSYIICYLHLVLLGMISSSLLAWAVSQGWIKPIRPLTSVLLLVGFVGMEFTLIGDGIPVIRPPYSDTLLLIFSAMIWVGCVVIVVSHNRPHLDLEQS